jgi:structural maintenance of chromosome 2
MRIRAVSLEGDDFNPGGLLTGGSRNIRGSILTNLHELYNIEQKTQHHVRRLREVESLLNSCYFIANQHHQISQEIQVRQHSLAIIEEKVQASNSLYEVQNVRRLANALADFKTILVAAQQKRFEQATTTQKKEDEIKSRNQNRTKSIEEIKIRLKLAKK